MGINHYESSSLAKALLAPDGVALLHSIGRMDGPVGPTLIRTYFPAAAFRRSQVVPAVEQSRLWVTDIEILRLHYAETLKSWRQRFERNRDRLRAIYDERFCRMWEMYLIGSEVAFRREGCMVFQMQLAKAIDSVPMTRDYMLDWEREQRAAPGRAA
jgi:cyclopropane-fatty-acyl-phospholipid synthase